MRKEIHIHKEGQQTGPYPEFQIQEMVNTGMLSPDDHYWVEGQDEWQRVGNTFKRTLPPPLSPGTSAKGEQSITLSAEHPGFWLRFAAHFIDTIIAYAAAFVAGFAIGFFLAISGETDDDVFTFFGAIGGFIAGWLYYALMESSKLQATLGKMACGFIVTDIDGKRVSFGRASGRYFGMILSLLTLFIGFIMCAFTEKKQCLHDILAGCLMYRKQ